jgi:ABC-2 type transport system permease protein
LVFILLPPLSHIEFFLAYVLAAIVRGLMVGLGVLIATTLFAGVHCYAVLWIVVFALVGAALLATMGLIAGIWADKFDQLAAFQNFIIVPATFLSGVFYSIHSLPPVWQAISHVNPFFYLIDGFRYGFFGQSDISPWFSLGVSLTALLLTSAFSIRLIARGYKLRF